MQEKQFLDVFHLDEQSSLELTAEIVGKQVRKAMLEISGTRPEELPLYEY